MATLNFPDAPDTGDTYSDANSGFEYEWNGTVWISIEAGKRSNIQEIDDISGSFNGSTTDFTLTSTSTSIEPTNAQQVVISLGGVLQMLMMIILLMDLQLHLLRLLQTD